MPAFGSLMLRKSKFFSVMSLQFFMSEGFENSIRDRLLNQFSVEVRVTELPIVFT